MAGQRLAVAALMTAGAVLFPADFSSAGAANAQTVAPAAPVAVAKAEVRDEAKTGASRFAAPGKTLKIGAKGTAVKVLQTRLAELGYAPGRVDGRYGGSTLSAVWAFQKVNGISPTSTVASGTWKALEAPRAPQVLVPKGKPTRVEVNLAKQLLVLYVNGRVRLISHISSGSGVAYCETATWEGRSQRFCGDARTPTGDYKTTWRRDGWHRSYLGQLYNPIFFNGGIAFHGALSVPLTPASHGCVRLPMQVAEVLPGLVGTGVPVHVRGRFVR
ncbi:L,D-transpeptidase family protein [Streptosporangium lutulentum]|uniref:Peptidoglycan hydrolase-like protein with peptidoglycan-binding domain n=1 Tax=Streptosporangium lutulentum TaxID=1461250 RepID=A0ABT9QER1_9ACTN|nr:L,D-transpeptidase family protein [Streptosporangium lutulentum]MDP9845167.1 peptidoglycan hydrolase-like protein with peptidoglycan-binding domain [Streptosporangium lutulentum]